MYMCCIALKQSKQTHSYQENVHCYKQNKKTNIATHEATIIYIYIYYIHI